MIYPHLTATYAALLALVYLVLSVRVIFARVTRGVNLGTGSDQDMTFRVRSHANFAEYVPLILILVGALEVGQSNPGTIHTLLLPLLVARVVHPVGVAATPDSVLQRVCRGGGTIITLLVVLISAVLLLVRALSA